MRFIDSEGKIFGLINVIDGFVLVLVLLVGFVGVSRFLDLGLRPERHEEGELQVEVTAEIRDIRQVSVDAIEEGDVVRDHVTNATIGTITDVEVMPYETEVETADGRVVIAEVPDRYTVEVTLECYGHKTGSAIQVGTYDIRIGNTITLQSGKYSARATVLAFEIIED